MLLEAHAAPTDPAARTLVRLLVGALLLLVARQWWWAWYGWLNVDEFENLQIIWLWQHGQLPLRDYLHPHLIVYNLILWPLYQALGPTADLPGQVRLALFPLVLLTIGQVYWIGRRLFDRSRGLLVAVLFLSSPLVGYCLAEMRPDVIAVPLVLGAVMCLLAYTRRRQASLRWVFAAGALLGLHFLFTQKLVFLTLALAWMLERHHARSLGWPGRRRLAAFALFAVPAVMPVIIAFGWYYSRGLLSWENFLMLSGNAFQRAPAGLNWQLKAGTLLRYARSGGLVLAFGLYGLGAAAREARQATSPSWVGAGLAVAYVGASLIQLLTMPVAFFHQLVVPHLFLAVLAVAALGRRKAWVVAVVVLAQLVLAHVVDRGVFGSRRPQVETFRYVLTEIPPDRKVLDGYRGYGTFRPITGQLLFFRPAQIAGPYAEQQLREVIRGLARRQYGAVIRDQTFSLYPEPLRRLIEINYEPSAQHADVLLPKRSGP